MDAPCKIQGSIHVFRLVNNMCPGKWVHINFCVSYILKGLQLECGKIGFCYSPFRVIHYNFVSIALEDIFYDVVDYDEWNDTNY